MKFYKLNDTWVSWDELHNGYGYTTEPSIAVTYKSAHNGSSWGEDAGSGYYVGDIDDMVHGSFWCDSDYGWFELDGLVWNPEIYPSNATPLMMQNGGLTSPAVSLESDGVTYYLIKVIVADTGWITADEATELGWEVYDEMQGTFIVFDTVENKIVSAFTNELTYGEIEGIVLQPPRLVYGVDVTVPTAQFWFTSEGRLAETDTVLPRRSILHDDNGAFMRSPNGTMYEGVPILAYMHVTGDMFLAAADGTFSYYGPTGSGIRTLTALNGEAVGLSAWSVFAERIFTLSFANTQLPGVTITMPADETGYKGTSITLPTMTGEYESGGKTWKPSAWDIGAFGSSYTLNADTVAHLIFEEVPQYEEITLYFSSSSNFVMQGQITSGFIGNVNGAYIYQLYTDAEHTTPWNGYDYSNDYEIGYYSSGNWVKRPIVQEMPDSTTSEQSSVISWILLDTGYVWGVSNIDTASRTLTFGNGSIVVRIRKKDQQYYAFYLSNSSVYDNYTLSDTGTRSIKGAPGISSATTVPWNKDDTTLPVRSNPKFYSSSMQELFPIGVDWSTSSAYFQITNNSGAAIDLRAVVFSLSVPTEFCYSLNKADTTVSYDSGHIDLYDGNGNAMVYDDACRYRVIGVFKANGDASTNSWSTITYFSISKMGDGTASLSLMNNQTLTFSKVWFIKTIEVNFGDPVTIPAGYHVESVRCQRLYVKASNVSYSAGNPVNFSFLGENEFCDDTEKSLVGAGVSPCLSIYAISSSVPDPVSGYWMSYRSTTTPSLRVFSISASNLNSGGVFIEGTLQMTDGDAGNSTVANALNAYPALFRRYDSNNTFISYYFKIQQSLWQLQNGVFSWLGDTTDASSLAYWYNGLAVRIILAKD